MKRKVSFIVLSIFAGLLSCEKSDRSENNISGDFLTENLTAASAILYSSKINQCSSEDIQAASVSNFDSLRYLIGNNFMGSMKFKLPHISSCGTVTESSSAYPKTITIDYGTGCTDHRGLVKTGKIVINIFDSIKAAGALNTIEYVDFYIDSTKVELHASQTNLGKNSDGYWMILSEYYQKFTNKEGNVMEENYIDTIKWLSGFETSDKSDDIYEKTGDGKITVNDTLSYSRSITKALHYDYNCDYISSGIVELYKNGNYVTIDYGDGTCDNKAILTVNGTSEEIDLSTRGFKEGGKFDGEKGRHGKKGGRGCKGNGFGF